MRYPFSDGGPNEIHLFGLSRARQLRKYVGERAQHDAGRVFQLQRRTAQERTFASRGTSSTRRDGGDRELEERKGCSDRRSVRGDEGAIGWNSAARSARSESRDSAHLPTSCSEVWDAVRDSASGGHERNREGERAAAAKGYAARRRHMS